MKARRNIHLKLFPARQEGQAALEYILLIFLISVLSLGLLYQFNKGFQRFAQNFFTIYISCLLESGELPQLGSDEGSPAGCEMPDFAWNPKEVSDAPGSQSSSRSSQFSSSGGESSSETTATSRGSGDSGGGGGSSRVPLSRADQVASGGKKSSKIPLSKVDKGKDDGSQNLGNVVTIEADQTPNKGRRARFVEAGEDEETKSKGKVTGPGAFEAEGKAGRQRYVDANLNRKPSEVEIDDGWSIGDFIKFLIIAAIVIALVIFLGGQAVQIKKGMEK